MGVEPIAARAVRPAADFEDREAHRDSYTPSKTIIAQVRTPCRANLRWLVLDFGNIRTRDAHIDDRAFAHPIIQAHANFCSQQDNNSTQIHP